jgi:signal transduction histidine kinase
MPRQRVQGHYAYNRCALEQIIDNLVENALPVSPPGTTIALATALLTTP